MALQPPPPPNHQPVPAPAGAPPPPAAGAVPLPVDEGTLHLGFFQQPWVQNVLPFVTSLVVHAAIVVLAVVLVAAASGAVNITRILNQEQSIIPEATSTDNANSGGVPNMGTTNDPTRQAMQDTSPDAGTPEGSSSTSGPKLDPSSDGGGSGDAAPGDVYGGTGPGGSRGRGSGLGQGDGASNGAGGGGPLAMFGPPGGGASGPKGPIFGNGGNAKKIIFVCDASGSMINKFSSLKGELNKAINNLRMPQSFNLVFFQDGKASVFSKDGLALANPENKRKASQFLEVITTTSTSDPIPGLTIAIQQQPDLMYLLTDGDFPDNAAVQRKIKELNKPVGGKPGVKINTIAFVNDKDTDTAFIKLLEEVASENKGTFRHVAENELN